MSFSNRTAYGRTFLLFSAGERDPKTISLQKKNVTNQGSDALSVAPVPAALALPENLLEMQTFMSYPRSTQS